MPSYFGIKISLDDSVYSPSDDSFLLADSVEIGEVGKVLDLGTGTGFLGILAAKWAKWVLATDFNEAALRLAVKNASENGISNIEFRKSDLFSEVSEKFDLIIFNPPYLPTEKGEPRDDLSKSWDGGLDGRETIDRFLEEVKEYLEPGGQVLMIGSSLSGYPKTMLELEKKGFSVTLMGVKKLDFEELVLISAIYNS
jgi:release factor glutamine methyltransferase